jgi:hypothetical protein
MVELLVLVEVTLLVGILVVNNLLQEATLEVQSRQQELTRSPAQEVGILELPQQLGGIQDNSTQDQQLLQESVQKFKDGSKL